jgi:hypothetical protein
VGFADLGPSPSASLRVSAFGLKLKLVFQGTPLVQDDGPRRGEFAPRGIMGDREI